MASLLLVIVATTFGAVTGVLVLLGIGIHRDDRAKTLTDAPRSHMEAATRRLLGVGVRTSRPEDEEA